MKWACGSVLTPAKKVSLVCPSKYVSNAPVTPLIAHGLMTACAQINDRQTPMTERERPTEMVTRIVRTPVRDDVGDLPDPRFIDSLARFVDDTANSTHVRRSETRSLPGVP